MLEQAKENIGLKSTIRSLWNMSRRKLKALNRNKLIVFVGTVFGIFFSHEVFMLVGVPVHDAEKELKITRAQIYVQYKGLTPPDSS